MKGKIRLKCEINGVNVDIRLIVINNKNIKLVLGDRDFIIYYKYIIDIRLIQKMYMVGKWNEKEKNQFIKNNKHIFEEFGNMPFKYKIILKDDVYQ